MHCGWGGNRRSVVTLAMRHRLQWFIHLRAHGLRTRDENPAYTPDEVRHTLPFMINFWRPFYNERFVRFYTLQKTTRMFSSRSVDATGLQLLHGSE